MSAVEQEPFSSEENLAVERALLILKMERLGDRMGALLEVASPSAPPLGPRGVLGAAMEVAALGLAGSGLAALLAAIDPRLGLLGALLALAGWSWCWRAGANAGLAEGEAALAAFEAACPVDHPLLTDHAWARAERETLRPPAPQPGLSVEISEIGGQIARYGIWAVGLILPVFAAAIGTYALLGARGFVVGAVALAMVVMIHDTDIAMRAALLPGVARAAGESLLFSMHFQEFSREMDELDAEARRLGLPLLRPHRYIPGE